MEFDGESNPDEDNLYENLEDIILDNDANWWDSVKRDNTFFVIDCSPEIMTPLSGEKYSEFDKVMESYENFLMSKVIANCNDRVGLILYNVDKKSNALGFENLNTVHSLDGPTAKMVKSVQEIKKNFLINYGHSIEKTPLHLVLWLFGQEIKDCDPSKNHMRLFLFTAEDNPHSESDERRTQSINHARQLADKGVHIELFPIKGSPKAKFEIRKFYQEIVSFDDEDLNKNLLDCSTKIMNLQTRIRQKEYKKRTLNRLLMQIGTDAEIGLKIYSLYAKAKKPPCKKLEGSTNKPLKRIVKRLNTAGEIIHTDQIGTYYPLGGERIRLNKEDMNKIKGLRKPGISLMGFKPRKYIKPYHNLRTSCFLYPDEEHVSGSSQFCDALIQELIETDQVAIISLMPRANQELRFAALIPQYEQYDSLDHHQEPPGFHMIFLPFAEDIVNFSDSDKVTVKPSKISSELLQITKLIVNNLTVRDFDFRDFENPSLQKFYSHLQSIALNSEQVDHKPDTLLPDYQGMSKYDDLFKVCEETADAEVNMQDPEAKVKYNKGEKKEEKFDDYIYDDNKKKSSSKRKKDKENEEIKYEKKSRVPKEKKERQEEQELIKRIEDYFYDGLACRANKIEMSSYLKYYGVDHDGSFSELVDRIMIQISSKQD